MCDLDIFVWMGSIFGYVVQFFFNIFNNYGVAIILFTIITRILMFPLNIKQQKTMAAQQRLQPKVNELKAKYGNDQQGLNAATQELYSKEGINPTGGCLPMLIQFPLMFGLYRAICKPLTCVLHLADSAIAQAAKLTGIADTSKNIYYEIDIIRKVAEGELGTQFAEIFGDKFVLVEEMSNGFRFLGLDLLSVASLKPINAAVILAVLVFIAQVASSIITNKINGAAAPTTPGCSPNLMAVSFGLMSLFIAFGVPSALVLYWIVSSLLGPVQSLVTRYFFGPLVMNAKAEAQRNALIIEDERKIYEEVGSRKGYIRLEPMEPKKKDEQSAERTSAKKQSGKGKKRKK